MFQFQESTQNLTKYSSFSKHCYLVLCIQTQDQQSLLMSGKEAEFPKKVKNNFAITNF